MLVLVFAVCFTFVCLCNGVATAVVVAGRSLDFCVMRLDPQISEEPERGMAHARSDVHDSYLRFSCSALP